ncbi:MAG: CZB domain-containing protein [Acidobacteriota bacterium]|nr:CZB domain-containing protein [Acidobacteriota bacterium]
MSSIPYLNKPILNARDAIATHIRWKITLLTAARMQEPLSERATQSIQQPDECAISRWILSDSTLPVRGTPQFAAVLARHREFHTEMQRIAKLLNAGLYLQAETQLASRTVFEQTSLALAHALMALDRLLAQPIAS